MAKVELKNLKIAANLSHETLAFTASIYVDGKRAGTAENRGQGGPNFYDWANRSLGKRAEEEAAALHGNDPEALDNFIYGLIVKAEDEKLAKKHCKTKVVFRLKGEKELRTIKPPKGHTVWTKRAKAYLEEKYAGRLEVIFNEKFYGEPKE